MRRRLIAGGLLLGAVVLAACGSAGPGVQARQAGDTTPSTTAATTTTTAEPQVTTPATTAPAVTAAPAPPCTDEALAAAYTARFGALNDAGLHAQKCVGEWATSSQIKGFDPPLFALYRAEGDHWVALNRSSGKLCGGQGVPDDVAPQIGCDG